jgi:hypothetical protein
VRTVDVVATPAQPGFTYTVAAFSSAPATVPNADAAAPTSADAKALTSRFFSSGQGSESYLSTARRLTAGTPSGRIARMRPRVSYANVVATLALFVALGGGAYAAFKLPAHSVGAKQLKNHAVTPSKLSRKTKALLKRGPHGATGAPGTSGATGAPGPTGPSDVYAAGTAFLALPITETSLGTMTVPAGSYLLQAKVTLESSTASNVGCTLGGPFGSSIIWDQGGSKHNAASEDIMSLSGVATFKEPQVVELDCRAITGTVIADDARVTAIKVGALHGTTPVD